MLAKLRSSFRMAACAMLMFSAALPIQAQDQTASSAPGVTADQLKALLPDAQELEGFVATRPLSAGWPEALQGKLAEDGIVLNKTIPIAGGQTSTFSAISRFWYSQSEMYTVEMSVQLYTSPKAAQDAIADGFNSIAVRYKPTTFSGFPIGDECWSIDMSSSRMLIRHGKAVISVGGSFTIAAAKQGNYEPFPNAAVEAIGRLIWWRLARQPALTGVPVQEAHVIINGKELPADKVLMVGDHVFVAVTEFAKASGWLLDFTGIVTRLSLTDPTHADVDHSVMLTALSPFGYGVDKGVPASLKSIVFKAADQPVMLLDDLLKLTKGHIIERKGNTLRITM